MMEEKGKELDDGLVDNKEEVKIYRVETFIILRKVNRDIGKELFCEKVQPDYRHSDFNSNKKLEIQESGMLEFGELSSCPRREFGSSNFEENSKVESRDDIGASESRGKIGDEKNLMKNKNGFDNSLNFNSEELLRRSQSYDFLPSLKSGSELKSIEESCETAYGSCEELCQHGNKNGCTVAAQSPSKVSEDIFKENWMQRLEFLRRRVSLIRDKEVALQERERILLKKEKELRILERLAKEKIQRADLYLKRCTIRNSTNFDDDLPQNFYLCELNRPSPPPYPERGNNVEENNQEADSREILNAGSRTSNRSSNSTKSGSSRGENINGMNLPPSGVKATTSGFEILKSTEESKEDFRRSKLSGYSSWRYRSKPKISYDDLDSTLSADIGDSSFAITSKKLDPRLVKKPRGFSRSASERGQKNRPSSLDLDIDLGPDGERVLRKINENISAVAERRGTKFQNYGLIDIKRHKSEPKIDDIENKKNNFTRINPANSVASKDQGKNNGMKERTSFWSEEASDWLRKKRQAYNLATKRIPVRDFENKENFANSKNSNQICEKETRTKNEKGKKFAIFR